ncbi:hypothetical protein [Cellulomonas sp.]|uniref:hypothetical protein n=1 Tax=Cellulomonas sp. TaxID=40001 RepID=UPI001B17833E|nr:hypothetical protein [Cellulomonas sp.]MBO9555560.1 hypothetical protein [Cellulomonas sp.]
MTATTEHLRPYHYPSVYDAFLNEVAEHELTVLHEDGHYRHLRFQRPGTGMWHWDLITWPWSLAIRGDIGEGFIFTRELDMLTFFDHGQPAGWINASYWAQKLDRGSRSVREFCRERFAAWLKDEGIDASLAADVESLHEATEALLDAGHDWDSDDVQAWEDYEYHFLVALHAILWGAKRYHAAKAADR